MKEKILARKPDIIRLWNFPKEIKDFTIDQDKNDRVLRQPFPPATAAARVG